MRARIALPIATLLLAAAALPAPAPASDASATHAYIKANYALAKAGVARIKSVQAKAVQFTHTIAATCPRAGTGAPQNEATQPISHEPVVALWSIAYRANAASISAFAAETAHLRWSNARTTHVAQRYARSLHEMATLPLPNLCTDVRAFAASGFKVVPPAVVKLVDRAEAIELNPVPRRLLAPHGSDASLFSRTVRLEQKLGESEFSLGQDDWIALLDTLGLPQ
jgi:hypothetical protein